VLESPRIDRMPRRDHAFSRQIRAEVRNLDRCYQCSMCSDGCPVAYAMDCYPNQVIHMVRLGLKDKALQSRAIWICASCETCATRCPNEIDIVGLMDVLRNESIKGGFKNTAKNIAKFHEVFIDEIKKKGRVDEARLLINYELKTGDFLSFNKFREEASLGIQMFRKGKIKLPSWKKHAQKEVAGIFKKVLSRR